MGLMFLALEPWAGWSGKGMGGLMWGTPHSLDVPSNFYPSHVGVGPSMPHLCISTSLHLRLSIPPTRLDKCDFFNALLSDFHTAQIYDDSG